MWMIVARCSDRHVDIRRHRPRPVKRQFVVFATSRARADLAAVLAASSPSDRKLAKAATAAIETLRGMPPPQPLIGDAVERWLPMRLVSVLRAAGIRTLADLTLRVPRRRRWWAGIEGLGPAGARHIEAFFAQHPALTEYARALVTAYFTPSRTPISRDRGQHFTSRRTPFHADRGQRFSVMADSCSARG